MVSSRSQWAWQFLFECFDRSMWMAQQERTTPHTLKVTMAADKHLIILLLHPVCWLSSRVLQGGNYTCTYLSQQSFILMRGCIDPFLCILVAMVFISEVKLSRLVSQFQASLTKLSALLWVMVQFRYNVQLQLVATEERLSRFNFFFDLQQRP